MDCLARSDIFTFHMVWTFVGTSVWEMAVWTGRNSPLDTTLGIPDLCGERYWVHRASTMNGFENLGKE
jgi:hypothetical protein